MTSSFDEGDTDDFCWPRFGVSGGAGLDERDAAERRRVRPTGVEAFESIGVDRPLRLETEPPPPRLSSSMSSSMVVEPVGVGGRLRAPLATAAAAGCCEGADAGEWVTPTRVAGREEADDADTGDDTEPGDEAADMATLLGLLRRSRAS